LPLNNPLRQHPVSNRPTFALIATDYQRIANLDLNNEVKPPATVSPSVGAAIAKGRMDKKDDQGKSMSQKDLATKINEKPSVVRLSFS
jgi:putative transcription factor